MYVSLKCECDIENFEVVITNEGNEVVSLEKYEINQINE